MTDSVKTDAFLGQLAVLAYGNPSDVATALSTNPEFSGWTINSQSIEGSFAAYSFKNEQTGQIVIAFRGTDGANDGLTDLRLAAGNWDTQFTQAINFANTVNQNANGNTVQVTGHSLGGALAQLVAKVFGFDGATLEAGAAERITQTQEYVDKVKSLALDVNSTAPDTFTNYLTYGSAVSGLTGEHIGKTIPMPTVDLTTSQMVTILSAFLVNPIAGFLYAIGVDQTSARHSSVQVAQALNLLAGLGLDSASNVKIMPNPDLHELSRTLTAFAVQKLDDKNRGAFMLGGKGNDTYVFQSGDGQIVVQGYDKARGEAGDCAANDSGWRIAA